jgi:hypothetical protein
VLTDVVERREGLRLPASAPTGTYFIIDARGVVVAETVKGDAERLIALSPGTYLVKRRLVDHLRIGQVKIGEGQLVQLDEGSFKNARFSDDPVKGTGITSVYSRHWSVAATGNFQAVFDRPTAAGGYFPSAPLVGGELTAHNYFGRGFGFSLDGNYGWATGTVASPLLGTQNYKYTLASFGAAALYEFAQDGMWVPYGGVHVAVDLMSRTFDDLSLPTQTYSIITPGVVLGLKVRLTKNFSIVARARVHYLLYNVDETRSLGSADVGALIDYEFRE